MLSYTSATSESSLLGVTIGDLFDQVVERYPNHEALVSRHQRLHYTYRELQREVNRAARALMTLGVAKGDRVGIWAPNCAEWTITQLATSKIGAILVNINPSYRQHELSYALSQSGTSVLVMAAGFKQSDYTAMIQELKPDLRAVVRLSQETVPGMRSWGELLAAAEETSERALVERQRQQDFDDPINIQYTSGTTGFPKGATLSHHNILNNGYFVGEVLRYSDADRICVPVPFYHCFGCVLGNMAAVTHGSAIVIPGESFDPELTLRAIEAERCTSIYGVPTMFIAQLDHPRFSSFRLETLRTGIMAGAPCPIDVMRQVIDRMHAPEVTICYGMTETSPVSFQSEVDDPVDLRVSTVGRVLPHLECKIVDPETAAIVPRGVAGELCTRGYSVMLGYWNDATATANAIDAARWMHSGDVAVMDAGGYVTISGRIKDMIIRGGENIYPREIEEFLYTHPDIEDAQVIGVPDERYGEETCAWIRMKTGRTPLDADAVRDFATGKLAHYKIPRYVRVVDEFPMTITGKVRKVDMRAESVRILGL